MDLSSIRIFAAMLSVCLILQNVFDDVLEQVEFQLSTDHFLAYGPNFSPCQVFLVFLWSLSTASFEAMNS